MDYSLPGSSVHGILQARILEWIAIPFSRGSSWPRDGKNASISNYYHSWNKWKNSLSKNSLSKYVGNIKKNWIEILELKIWIEIKS